MPFSLWPPTNQTYVTSFRHLKEHIPIQILTKFKSVFYSETKKLNRVFHHPMIAKGLSENTVNFRNLNGYSGRDIPRYVLMRQQKFITKEVIHFSKLKIANKLQIT